jgi:hypothetical protein
MEVGFRSTQRIERERARIASSALAQLFDGSKLEGTESVDIGWGFQLKANGGLTVIPQEVVPLRSIAADGWSVTEATKRGSFPLVSF